MRANTRQTTLLQAQRDKLLEVCEDFVDACLAQDIKLGSLVGDAQDVISKVHLSPTLTNDSTASPKPK